MERILSPIVIVGTARDWGCITRTESDIGVLWERFVIVVVEDRRESDDESQEKTYRASRHQQRKGMVSERSITHENAVPTRPDAIINDFRLDCRLVRVDVIFGDAMIRGLRRVV